MRGLGRQWARQGDGPLSASFSFDIFRMFKAGQLRPVFFVFGVALMAAALSGPAEAACTESICYEYDVLGRLVKTIMPGGGAGGSDQTIEYTYDAAGNRTERIIVTGNLPPDAVTDIASTDYNQNLDVFVLVNDTDPENQTLTIISVTQPLTGSVSIYGGGTAVVYTPSGTNASYQDSFNYTISDGNGGTDSAVVRIAVSGSCSSRSC